MRIRTVLASTATFAILAGGFAGLVAASGPEPTYDFPDRLAFPAVTGEYLTVTGDAIPVDADEPLPQVVINDVRDGLPALPSGTGTDHGARSAYLLDRADAIDATGHHVVFLVENGQRDVASWLIALPASLGAETPAGSRELMWDDLGDARADLDELLDAAPGEWGVIDLTR